MNFSAARNEKIRYIIAVICVVTILMLAWFLFGEPDLQNQRNTASSVRESLEHAGSEQRRTSESIERIRLGLDDSIESAKRIEESNSAAEDAATRTQERIRRSEGIARDSERRIKESQRILQSVRESAGQD